jgi:hypothetical protein
MKPNLKVVPKEKKPKPVYDPARGVTRLVRLREALLTGAVQFVIEGKEGTLNDRIRKASEITGISRSQIEIASEK